jgi:hypothetical protein
LAIRHRRQAHAPTAKTYFEVPHLRELAAAKKAREARDYQGSDDYEKYRCKAV